MTLENVFELISIVLCTIFSGIAGYLVCYVRTKEREWKKIEEVTGKKLKNNDKN